MYPPFAIGYTKCFLGIPAFVATGFDLSVDNCVYEGISDSFVDYGQCNRFDETENSDWWAAHRKSFAEKQIFSYEKGLGWSFSAWKLYGEKHVGVIDSPAKLLSLKDVSAAGLLPPLDGASTSLACLNPPASDFVLGDDTLAPSPGPPPDCGNGWWNFDLQACEYWVPHARTHCGLPNAIDEYSVGRGGGWRSAVAASGLRWTTSLWSFRRVHSQVNACEMR
ncbi:hypothetical protein MHU86_24795 [Fragilaria crotonensis]|nr:hypothetical protein MHU86_24795 [Fragilaria crotonensis]